MARRCSLPSCLFVLVGAAAATLIVTPMRAQTPVTQVTTLVIASFGGQLDEAFKKALKPFEEKYNVAVRWVPGTAAENAAKIVATKSNPEYDVVLLENLSHEAASRQEALAPINELIATNYRDVTAQARVASKDGVGVGFFITGIFYNLGEFTERGWAPPTSWDDLFRQEFCGYIGVMHPNVSYAMHMLLMLAGGDPAQMSQGIARFAKLKNCIPTLEPSASKFEEKNQLREYLVGVHASIRAIPLIKQGYPIKYIIPKEGSILGYSIVSPVKNARNARLAQELCNWLIGPEAQKVLMETAFYVPVNEKIEVSQELQQLGMPDKQTMEKIIPVQARIIAERRREWVRQVEREMSR